mgnify:FL=1
MAITKNSFVFRKGGDTLDYTPASAVTAGTIVKVDGLFGLALRDIAANEAGTLKILHRGEVVEVTADDAIGSTSAGVAIYVVDATGLISKSSTNATLLGYTAEAVGDTDKTFKIVCV